MSQKYEHKESLWNYPQVEIEHDRMEAERKDYNDIGISGRIVNKLNLNKR